MSQNCLCFFTTNGEHDVGRCILSQSKGRGLEKFPGRGGRGGGGGGGGGGGRGGGGGGRGGGRGGRGGGGGGCGGDHEKP